MELKNKLQGGEETKGEELAKKFRSYFQALKNARADETVIFDYKTGYFYLIRNKTNFSRWL